MTSPGVRLNDGPRLDGTRVLVVDDAPEMREVVTDILTQYGAKVTAVGSAEEALAGAPPLCSSATSQCRGRHEPTAPHRRNPRRGDRRLAVARARH